MRTLHGQAVLPDTVTVRWAARIVVEVRDVSLADAPSQVVAARVLEDVPLEPDSVVGFDLEAPEAQPGHTLALRIHVDTDGSGVVAAGDLITTQHLPVPASGEAADLRAPLTQI